jgi:hypothetical protein
MSVPPCDAQKSWSLRRMDWKEDFGILDLRFQIYDFGLRGDYT